MKPRDLAPPTRLADLPGDDVPQGHGEGADARDLLRLAAQVAPAFSPAARRRLRQRLRATLSRAAYPRPRRMARLVLVASMFALLLGGGLVGAAIPSTVARWFAARRASTGLASPVTTPEPAIKRAPARRGTAMRANELALDAPPAPAQPVPAVPEAAQVAPPAGPRRVGVALARRPSEAPAQQGEPPRPAVPADGDDAAWLATAMRRLRADGDAPAALAVLDERGARFASGAFSAEAIALRVEALLVLKRPRDALAELDRLSPGTLPRGEEWSIVRGELRGAASRWSEAETDFDTAWRGLMSSAMDQGALAERALWGRATARAWRGDRAAARGDWADYVRRFPRGQFTAEAARLLASSDAR